MPKDPAFYTLDWDNQDQISLVSDLNDDSHGRQRKIFSHAFSDRALRDQESLILTHVDKLISKLTDFARDGTRFNFVDWVSFTTFDIMSDLAFGEPLNMLE